MANIIVVNAAGSIPHAQITRNIIKMEINENGTKKELLNVWMFKTHEGDQPATIDWDFGDRENAYFLIGVLETIKAELIDHIKNKTDEEFEE